MKEADEEYPLDWVFLDGVRPIYDQLVGDPRTAFKSVVDFLCRRPWIDGELKVALTLDDGTELTLYDDGEWQVIYGVLTSRVIEIWALSQTWFGGR